MFKKIALAILAGATLSPMVVLADAPNWTFAEISYVSSETDDSDVSPEGFEVAGSYALGDWAFADIRYLEEDNSSKFNTDSREFKLDLTRERLRLGIGGAWRVIDNTDIYGRLAYENWTLDAKIKSGGFSSSDDSNESGYSFGAGVRSLVWQALELRAEVYYIDVDEITGGESGFELGAYYTFVEHVTVGASYEKLEDYETYRATLRYQF